MGKAEIIALVGEPDHIATPKNHELNTREDVWYYSVPFVNSSGEVSHSKPLILVFPYLESQSPQAKLVGKWWRGMGQSLHERDPEYYRK